MQVKYGAKQFTSKPVMQDLSPEFNLEVCSISFKSRLKDFFSVCRQNV